MKITITCPGCGRVLHTDSAYAGKKSRCPKCDEAIWVPHAHEPNAAGPASATEADCGAHDAPPAAPAAAESGEAAGRVPCPLCAELIMPDAAKCRFCGSLLKPSREDVVEPRPSLNAPALLSLALGLLAYPTVAICFLEVFRERLAPSLLAGVIVSSVACVTGVWGIVLATRKRQGQTAAWRNSIVAMATLLMLWISLIATKETARQTPKSMPMVRQILGIDKPKKIRMKCPKCGKVFQVDAPEVFSQQVVRGLQALGALGGDINKVLDSVNEHAPAASVKCPKCGADVPIDARRLLTDAKAITVR